MRHYYAQNKEDLFIKGFFPDVRKGFYIDVGANDPVIDSVTKLLYDEGWSGINIEPITHLAEALKKARPRDTTLRIGISDKEGTLTFTEYPEGNGLSTFDKGMQEYYEQNEHPFPTQTLKHYEVPVRTLRSVFTEVKPGHIHVLKVDVEGYEYEVLAGNDWERYRPELICIEANHIEHDWRPLLATNHYELVFFDGVNNYYLAQESLNRKEYFNYPDIVFAGNPVYYPAAREIEQPYQQQVDQLRTLLDDREQQIWALQRQQRDIRFLAKQLALEVQIRLNKRAKGTKRRGGHWYHSDPTLLSKVSTGADKKQLVTFIHDRDKVNIVPRSTSFTEVVRPMFWKCAAWGFALALRVAKKVRRIVR